jgi:Na+-driven multidrug efflux pump
MKYPSQTAGLFQAAGLTVYVAVFAFMARCFVAWSAAYNFEPEPPLGIVIFLLAFIISATICASIMFGYPASLFFANKKKEAVHVVLWSIGWLSLFLSILLVVGLSLFMA